MNYDYYLPVKILHEASQRLALANFGRAEIRFEMWKKLEARKLLLEAADSQKSAARFVRRLYERKTL